MKTIFTTLFICCLYTISFGGALWYISPEKEIATPGEQLLQPTNYLLAKLDIPNFRALQSGIPTEDQQSYPVIELPNPAGELESYYIFESPMMAMELANKFPEIKTYTLVHTQNPIITGKADFTYWGFHAKIFNGKNTYFIDPYKRYNNEWYFVYYKKDYTIPANERMQCLIDEEIVESEIHSGEPVRDSNLPQLKGQRKTFGTEKRTYRLALACTEEYAAAVGGANPTKASVLSAMVTTMNRVNGVFERDFSMMAQLIANNTDVIFLPGSNDPYTNSSGSTMLGQNQTTLNNIIGAANFDFGHVFSTGGGGIANLACVCRTSKARGVTGRSNPVGDPFDIDYVAHEMGHQFGGSHTFNSIIGSCQGNGSSNSAYEPGSATTIMGYAGLCGSDDVQNNSDDYYHIRSLMQMSDHMDGLGNCAAKVPTNNTPPVLGAINQTYYIPYKTFFELTANATDAENNPITYCWEQWDLGAFGPWNTVSTGNPLFRSYPPTSSNVRVFPIMSRVIPEVLKVKGEVLPEVTRNISFKVAARDINNGNGAFNYSDNELQVEAIDMGSNLFRVTSHDVPGQKWNGDAAQTVTWNPAGTQSGQINTPTVDIYFSLDKGETWPYLCASNVPNTGSYSIIAPNISTTNGLIKVKGHNNIFFDVNNTLIEVIAQPYPVGVKDYQLASLTIFPNPVTDRIILQPLKNDIASIELLAPNGHRVQQFEVSNELSVSHISNGLYFLRLRTTDNQIVLRKINIQR